MTRTYVTWQENSSLTCATAVFADRIFSDAIADFFFQPKPIDTQVISHHMQRFAVWFGGSMLASTVGEKKPRAIYQPLRTVRLKQLRVTLSRELLKRYSLVLYCFLLKGFVLRQARSENMRCVCICYRQLLTHIFTGTPT